MRTLSNLSPRIFPLAKAYTLVITMLFLLIAPAEMARAAPAGVSIPPSYLKVEAGTTIIGGLSDLLQEDGSVVLLPETCHASAFKVALGLGFVLREEASFLDIAGTIKVPTSCRAELVFVQFQGDEDGFSLPLTLRGSGFHLAGIPLDSGLYQNPITSEVALRLVVRCDCCGCGPPTDSDAVVVQQLTMSPTPR